jgi:type IX secretion system PorP/SprF family membrane protein
MKYFFYISFIIFGWRNFYSQQIPVFSNVGMNNFILNPAHAGSKPYMVVNLKQRLQYTGIQYAPNTQYLDVHSSISNKNFGVGGYIYNETLGVLGKLHGNLTYAYHIPLGNDNKLSFGISAKINQNRTLSNRMILDSQNDVLLNLQTNQRKTFFGSDAGILLHGENYKLGFSVVNLYSTKYDLYNGAKLDATPHLNLEYGFSVYLGGESKLKFSGRNVFHGSLPTWSQTDVLYDLNQKFYTGLGYRWKDAMIVMVGANVWKDLQVYYAYDIGVSKVRNIRNGSHEITLRYHFHYDPIYSRDKARYSNKVYRGWKFSFKRKPKVVIPMEENKAE